MKTTLTRFGLSLALLGCVAFLAACSKSITKKGEKIIGFDKLQFEKNNISIGDSSDIVFPHVAPNNLEISFKPDSNIFRWRLLKPSYIRINGKSENAIQKEEIRSIVIANRIIPFSELDKIIRNYDNDNRFKLKENDQNYLPLEILLHRMGLANIPAGIQSIYSTKTNKLILLDNIIGYINKNGERRALRMTDTVSGKQLKLELFSAYRYSLYPTNRKKNFLKILDTSYHVKVNSEFTNFGASVLYISSLTQPNRPLLSVAFDKPYRYAYSKEFVREKIKSNSNIPINISQASQATIFTNDIIIPNFSYYFNRSLGEINSPAQIKLHEALKEYKRSGYLVCLLPLMIVFGIILLLYFFPQNISVPKFLLSNLYVISNNSGERISWRNHFGWLFVILFVFLAYRIFIGYQLTYTGPYFTSKLPLTLMIAPLVLTAVYGIWMACIFRFGLVVRDREKNIVRRLRVIQAGIILCLLVTSLGICYLIPEVKNYLETMKLDSLHPLKLLKSELGPVLVVSVLVGLLLLNELIAFMVGRRKATLISSPVKYRKTLTVLYFILLLVAAKFIDNAYSALLLLAMLSASYLIFSFRKKEGESTNFSGRLYGGTAVILSALGYAAFAKSDPGYFINIPLVIFMMFFVSLFTNEGMHWARDRSNRRKVLLKKGLFFGVVVIGLYVLGKIYTNSAEESVSNFSDRTYTRLTTFNDFDKVEQAGFRISESYAQFFAVLSTYSDAGANGSIKTYHPIISSFSDPVVLNDLSFPAAGLAPWGAFYWIVLTILLICWFLLLRTVLLRSLYPVRQYDSAVKQYNYMTSFGMLRLICVSYLVGSGLWLIASYYGLVPFTGRLLFGFGQDSVAEVLELILLFSGMGLVYQAKQDIIKIK
ncbi:MAG: hypothetical protein JNK27_11780 [Chitinophagaceae bacterium]|nr:hypothetical protein [Chitinophagaceae bacterium]